MFVCMYIVCMYVCMHVFSCVCTYVCMCLGLISDLLTQLKFPVQTSDLKKSTYCNQKDDFDYCGG